MPAPRRSNALRNEQLSLTAFLDRAPSTRKSKRTPRPSGGSSATPTPKHNENTSSLLAGPSAKPGDDEKDQDSVRSKKRRLALSPKRRRPSSGVGFPSSSAAPIPALDLRSPPRKKRRVKGDDITIATPLPVLAGTSRTVLPTPSPTVKNGAQRVQDTPIAGDDSHLERSSSPIEVCAAPVAQDPIPFQLQTPRSPVRKPFAPSAVSTPRRRTLSGEAGSSTNGDTGMTSSARGSPTSQNTQIVPSSQSELNSQTKFTRWSQAVAQAREAVRHEPPPTRQKSVIPMTPWSQDVTVPEDDSQFVVPSSQTQELTMSPVSDKGKSRSQPVAHKSSDGGRGDSTDESVVPTSQPWADKDFHFFDETHAVNHSSQVAPEYEVSGTSTSREPPRTPHSDAKHLRYT